MDNINPISEYGSTSFDFPYVCKPLSFERVLALKQGLSQGNK
jgi:hypothetical protein